MTFYSLTIVKLSYGIISKNYCGLNNIKKPIVYYMEDYLNYMNSVSESESVLNQVNAIRENIVNQADEKVEQKDQLKEEITGIPSEMLISTAGAYLGKKALSYAASKLGVSEEAVSKVASGDIEGGVRQGLGDIAKNNLPVKGQGTPTEEPQLQGPQMEQEQGGDIELEDLSPPSQEEALQMLRGQERPTITSEDLPEGAGEIQAGETPITDAGEVAGDVGEVAGDVGEVVSSAVGGVAETLGSVGSAVGGAISSAGSAVSSAVSGAVSGATTAAEVGADTGLEAAGAALDATGIGSVAGAFLGLIGGLVGLFEGSHHDAPKIVEPFEPLLNPSSQIL